MIKIIKILTAIGNQNLNTILKKEKDFEIIENDIFYKEGILEFLEKDKKIDILILYEKLSGEINIINLIKKIKIINSEINIFFILEDKNEDLENLLKIENIKNIFYNNEINIEDFIIKLKNTKINIEEKLEKEIKLLKNIIQKKDEELLKYKNNDINNYKFFSNYNNSCEKENINKEKKYFVNILKNNPNKKIIAIKNNEKIEIIIHKINKYYINKKIAKNVLKKINKN